MLSNFYVSIDLGSNSFRLLIAKIMFTKYGCQVLPILNDRQPVGLASGLNADNYLIEESIQRAIQAFNNFNHIINLNLDNANKNYTTIFIVATSTFRIAKNIDILIHAGQKILGAEIKIISGIEEAKLIYQGTSHTAPYTPYNRLVIDIGGGSTEFIIGKNHQQLLCESVNIGCINITQRFFKEQYSFDNFSHAIEYAEAQLSDILDNYLELGWIQSIGSSGTSRALAYIASQIDNNESEYILTKYGLNIIKDYLIKCKNSENIKIKKINSGRTNILAGGLSIMMAVFNSFNIRFMHVCEGGVRFGLLYERLDTIQHDDIRNISIDVLRQRFSENDINNSQEVDEILKNIANRFVKTLNKTNNIINEEQIQLLTWALNLYNIGKYISLDSMHKHSAYILKNTYLAGFELKQQNDVVNMVLGQKGGLLKLDSKFIKEHMPILLILRLCLLIVKHGLLKDLYSSQADLAQSGSSIHVTAKQQSCEFNQFSLEYIDGKYNLICPTISESKQIFEEEIRVWEKAGIKIGIE